jgi:tRNA dimethylallyltransferase
MSLDDAFDAAVRRTRRFARRQRVWFGRDPRVRGVDGTQPIGALVREIAGAWSAPVATGAVVS